MIFKGRLLGFDLICLVFLSLPIRNLVNSIRRYVSDEFPVSESTLISGIHISLHSTHAYI